MSEFAIIGRVLNIYYTIHSARSNEYLLRDWRIQYPVEDLRWSALEKNQSLRGF